MVRTQQSNVFSIPSDCPTREKRGWMGDAQTSSGQALRNLGMAPLYEAWEVARRARTVAAAVTWGADAAATGASCTLVDSGSAVPVGSNDS